MVLYEKIYILQLAKDILRSVILLVILCVSIANIIQYQLIIACGILLLSLDLFFAALHIIYKKFTFADLKDFISVLCLLIYVILTLFIYEQAVEHRVVYCIFYAFFAAVDIFCVVIHISGFFLFYTERISVGMHNSAARAFNLDNSTVSPY